LLLPYKSYRTFKDTHPEDGSSSKRWENFNTRYNLFPEANVIPPVRYLIPSQGISGNIIKNVASKLGLLIVTVEHHISVWLSALCNQSDGNSVT
jgi:hypothetical protein